MFTRSQVLMWTDLKQYFFVLRGQSVKCLLDLALSLVHSNNVGCCLVKVQCFWFVQLNKNRTEVSNFLKTIIKCGNLLYKCSELLTFYKFPGDDIPIIRGSALSALQGTNEEIGKNAILKLMDAVDSYIPDPVRQLDKPFLMPIEDVFSIQVFSSFLLLSISCITHAKVYATNISDW